MAFAGVPLLHAQSSGGFTIPGVSDQYNTQGMIDKIMKLQSAPVDRLKKSVDDYKKQKDAWGKLSQKMKQLQDSAQKLYGFQNPFSERTATSSNDAVLTATATRQATEHTNTIVVKQLAEADKFLSKDLPNSFHVPAGTYGFKVGKEQKSFNFRGGSLGEFADAINKNVGTMVQAQVVRNTMSTQVMVIQAKKTGAENGLSFLKDAETFSVAAGIMSRSLSNSRDLPINSASVTAWTHPLSPDREQISSGVLTLKPGSEASLPVTPPLQFASKMVLSLEIQVKNLGSSGYVQPSPPPGPSIPIPGGASLGGLSIQNNPSEVPLPHWQPPPPPPSVEDHQILFAQDGSSVVPLPQVQDTSGFKQITIPLTDYVKGMTALNLRNRNTSREISIKDVRIYDPASRGDYSPTHAVTQAQDAKLMIDGVEAVRGTNQISDLVPGTTLNLQAASPAPVILTVEPDRKLVKNTIIEFIGRYNQVLTTINILTSTSQAVIDEISYFTDAQKQQAQSELGMFQGDMTFSMLKSKLQDTMMSAYPTDLGDRMSLLVQIGISTNSGGPGSSQGFDISRLRGYLEIDEQKLDSALKGHFKDVKQLFGSDTNGDLIIDSGVALKIDQIVNPYVQVGGIVAMREQSLDSQISRSNKEIASMNRRLDQKRADLKDQFARMQGAMTDLQKQSQALGGLGGSTGGSQSSGSGSSGP